jgi:hypothetical protein
MTTASSAFPDGCLFRIANGETVVARENIQSWSANYLRDAGVDIRKQDAKVCVRVPGSGHDTFT